MKYKVNVLIAIAGIVLAGCATSKRSPTQEIENRSEAVAAPASEKPTVTGVVTEIQPGKDGYTARIKTQDGKEYFATISRANLQNPETYRTAQPGDTLTVSGDLWQMEGKDQITVRVLE